MHHGKPKDQRREEKAGTSENSSVTTVTRKDTSPGIAEALGDREETQDKETSWKPK